MRNSKLIISERLILRTAKYVLSLLILFAVSSCDKNEAPPAGPTGDPISISGVYDTSDEISLSGPAAWSAGDTILYYDNLSETATRNLKMPLIGGINGVLGEFGGVLRDNSAQPNRKISAVYPASAAFFSEAGLVRMTLPDQQTQHGSYDILSLNKYCFMVGSSVTIDEVPSKENAVIAFHHVVGLVDLNITNIPVGEYIQRVTIAIPDSVDASPIVVSADFDVVANTLELVPAVFAKRIAVNLSNVSTRTVHATIAVFPMDLTAYSDVMEVRVSTKKADNTETERSFLTNKLARVYTAGERFALTVDAGLTSGDVTYGEVRFADFIFMDRNLGATIPTNEENVDDPRSYGNYYQFGLTSPYPYSLVLSGNLPLIQGPLSLEAGKISSSFITVASGSWCATPWTFTGTNQTDKWTEWTGITPAPAGWRVPSNQDAFIIMQGSNTVTPRFIVGAPIFQNQSLTYAEGALANIGISAGDGKTIYGIKKYGTESAYAVRWEYKASPEGRVYLKLTAIPDIGALGDFPGSTNQDKLASAISIFNDVSNQAKFQVLIYPAIGSITNAGVLSGNKADVLYWHTGTSSANGYAYFCNTSTSGTGSLYTVKAPSYGCPIRCIKN